MDVTSWYQSHSLSELEEHSRESGLKLWKRVSKMIFKWFQNPRGGCRVYDQLELVSRPQNTIQLFDIVIY